MQYFLFYKDQLYLEESSPQVFRLPQALPFPILEQDLFTFQAPNGLQSIVAMVTKMHDLGSAEAKFFSMRSAMSVLSADYIKSIAYARAILHLNVYHGFCGRCRVETLVIHAAERHCPACEHHFYPRISPSIIVRIERGPEILMVRGPHFAPGVYALVAGFVEAGESLEEAVRREIREEVNLEVKNIRYLRSQPWPTPDSLMLAFSAQYKSGDIKVDGHEIEAAAFYTRDKIPGMPSVPHSIATKMIRDFLKRTF